MDLVVSPNRPHRTDVVMMTPTEDERANTRPRKPPNHTVGVEGIKIRMDQDVSRVVTMISTNLGMEDRVMMKEGRPSDPADKILTAQEGRITMGLGGKKASDVLPTLVEPKASGLE